MEVFSVTSLEIECISFRLRCHYLLLAKVILYASSNSHLLRPTYSYCFASFYKKTKFYKIISNNSQISMKFDFKQLLSFETNTASLSIFFSFLILKRATKIKWRTIKMIFDLWSAATTPPREKTVKKIPPIVYQPLNPIFCKCY